MKSQDYQDKIDKVRADIEKKKALIEKKKKKAKKLVESIMTSSVWHDRFDVVLMDSSSDNLLAFSRAVDELVRQNRSASDSEVVYWLNCDLEDCIESIRNNEEAIKNKLQTISRYEDLLQKALVKEESLRNLPESMIELKERTITAWDAWDAKRKEAVRQAHTDYYALSDESRKAHYAKNDDLAKDLEKKMNDIYQSFSSFEWHELYCMSEEEIHRRNVQGAEDLVENLYDRVCQIVDTIEDASDLKVTAGNEGFAVINGTVKGHGKVAKVQSVGAGGWNIQRWHIRTLVHEVKGVA